MAIKNKDLIDALDENEKKKTKIVLHRKDKEKRKNKR